MDLPPFLHEKVIRKLINENKIEKCSLNLSNKICKPNAKLTYIKTK